MVSPLLISALAAGGMNTLSALPGLLGGKKTVRPEDFYTPQQLAAQSQLSNFASTGSFGKFQAGEDVGLGYGDFNVTAPEKQGLSGLQSLLSSGIPDQYKMGDAALQDLLATSPDAINKQFEPYRGLMERQVRDSNTALKRNAAFAGNLYSTDTVRGLGDIQARGNETMSAKLADLTNQALDRRLQAIPLAFQSAQGQEALNMGRIDASQRYGALTRNLNDASIKARDAEILRRRQELQLPIQAAESIAGQAGRSFPTMSESPYQQLLGQIGGIAGSYAGNELFLNQYKRFMAPGAGGGTSTAAPMPAFPQGFIPTDASRLSLFGGGSGYSRYS